LIDLSPEAAGDEADEVFALVTGRRGHGLKGSWEQERLRSGSDLLLIQDGFETRDVLAEHADFVGFFHLAGLFAAGAAGGAVRGLRGAWFQSRWTLGREFLWKSWCVSGWRLRLDDSTFTRDEAAVKRKLGVGEAESLFGDGGGDTGEFEKNGTGLDLSDVKLDRAFALALAHFGRLLRNRLVWEHADPEFPLALEVAGNGDARSLDLLAGHRSTSEGLQAEIAKKKACCRAWHCRRGSLSGDLRYLVRAGERAMVTYDFKFMIYDFGAEGRFGD